MSNYSMEDIATNTDRYKIYVLLGNQNELVDNIAFVKSHNISVINIGKELATYIDGLEDYSYLTIDACDFIKKLLDSNKSKMNSKGNDVVAVYNLGVLLEPVLELNAVHLFKEFSKSTSLVIIWDNQFGFPNRLEWPSQSNNLCLDFSETQIKKLQYAI